MPVALTANTAQMLKKDGHRMARAIGATAEDVNMAPHITPAVQRKSNNAVDASPVSWTRSTESTRNCTGDICYACFEGRGISADGFTAKTPRCEVSHKQT
ncbi:hypothetical protein C84B14_12533 [Salinisphaera sp. C84B14]